MTIIALAATKYDRFIGGSFMLRPKELVLDTPATISITLTDAAISTYRGDISESDLTLAYFDQKTFEYVPISSTYDRNTKTITGQIPVLYGDGIVVIEKR